MDNFCLFLKVNVRLVDDLVRGNRSRRNVSSESYFYYKYDWNIYWFRTKYDNRSRKLPINRSTTRYPYPLSVQVCMYVFSGKVEFDVSSITRART